MKNLYELGRRIERLLMLAGPLAFFCLIFLLISYSNTIQIENQIARRLRFAADAIFENIADLENKYKLTKSGQKNIQDINKTIYSLSLKGIALQIDGPTQSLKHLGGYVAYSETISPMLKSFGDQPPRQFANSLAEEAEKLQKIKGQAFGIELPEKAKINVFGTEIGLTTSTYLTLLQVSLSPILILWLGSIYVTRFRETVLIKDVKRISDMYPHMINLYPIGKIPEMRKRNWFKYHQRHLIFFTYFLARLAFLLIFIGPPIIAYAYGSYLQFNIDSNLYPMLLGGLVMLMAFFTLLAELLPFHFTKIFTDHDYPLR